MKHLTLLLMSLLTIGVSFAGDPYFVTYNDPSLLIVSKQGDILEFNNTSNTKKYADCIVKDVIIETNDGGNAKLGKYGSVIGDSLIIKQSQKEIYDVYFDNKKILGSEFRLISYDAVCNVVDKDATEQKEKQKDINSDLIKIAKGTYNNIRRHIFEKFVFKMFLVGFKK